MPIYRLTDELIFPPVEGAEGGIVAVGGDLNPDRLKMAYRLGIFPWYSDDQPIIWWSPDPRFVLFVDQVHVSRSMKRVLNSGVFKVTYNQNFNEVIANCKDAPRVGQDGTWITDEMEEAYIHLHSIGEAESIEVWKDDEIVGGMYGIRLGKVFSGESMFSKVNNASKVGLVTFLEKFRAEGGHLLDCQVHTDHLASLGAVEISREEFLNYLN